MSGKMGPVNINSLSPQKQVAYVCELAETEAAKQYWNQTGEYFSGCWWQDEKKLREASRMLKKAAKNKPISLNDLAENEQTRQMETIQALVSLKPQDNLAQTINSVEDILGSYGSKEQVAAFDEYRHRLTKKDIEVLEKFHNNNDYVGMNYWLDNKLDAGWRDILSGMYILTMAKLYQWGAETPKTKGNKGNAAKEDAVKKNDAGEGAGGAGSSIRDKLLGEVENPKLIYQWTTITVRRSENG
ncbi:MAG: hypothetical protein PHR92_14365 [Lachnospiraceae bacterium]|nr:hypothetical protein [Lachnospiraceae bacterium]